MRKLILLAVTLHLVITVKDINCFRFGDIISFKKTCACVPVYKHYAIYVGDANLPDRNGNQDMFHVSKHEKGNICVFGTIAAYHEQPQVDNYLDGMPGINVGTPNEISERIREKANHCKPYDLRKANCEHLATFIRYGEQSCKQGGTLAQIFCKRNGKSCSKTDEKLIKVLKELEDNAILEDQCMRCKKSNV